MNIINFRMVSSGPPKKYEIATDGLKSEKYGIVFGKITKQRFFGLGLYNADGWGRAIEIKNIETGEQFKYTGAYYFDLKLPEGTYQIAMIYSPAGPLLPKQAPFKFKVTNNTIKYIGSIVGDRDLIRHLERKKIVVENAHTEILGFQEYGVGRRKRMLSSEYVSGKLFIKFFVIDEQDI